MYYFEKVHDLSLEEIKELEDSFKDSLVFFGYTEEEEDIDLY